VTHHQVDLTIYYDVAADAVLTGIDRLQRRPYPVIARTSRIRHIGVGEYLGDRETRRAQQIPGYLREDTSLRVGARGRTQCWKLGLVACGHRAGQRPSKVADSLCCRRNAAAEGSPSALAAPLLVPEEEDPVLPYRAAEVVAEVVVAERAFRLVA